MHCLLSIFGLLVLRYSSLFVCGITNARRDDPLLRIGKWDFHVDLNTTKPTKYLPETLTRISQARVNKIDIPSPSVHNSCISEVRAI